MGKRMCLNKSNSSTLCVQRGVSHHQASDTQLSDLGQLELLWAEAVQSEVESGSIVVDLDVLRLVCSGCLS